METSIPRTHSSITSTSGRKLYPNNTLKGLRQPSEKFFSQGITKDNHHRKGESKPNSTRPPTTASLDSIIHLPKRSKPRNRCCQQGSLIEESNSDSSVSYHVIPKAK